MVAADASPEDKARALENLRRWQEKNRETTRIRANAWYLANKDRARASRRMRQYGLSDAEYAALLDRHTPGCPGCGSDTPLQIDHDHRCCPGKGSCGKCVRGMLCAGCNRSIGYAGDSAETLNNLISYLNNYQKGN